MCEHHSLFRILKWFPHLLCKWDTNLIMVFDTHVSDFLICARKVTCVLSKERQKKACKEVLLAIYNMSGKPSETFKMGEKRVETLCLILNKCWCLSYYEWECLQNRKTPNAILVITGSIKTYCIVFNRIFTGKEAKCIKETFVDSKRCQGETKCHPNLSSGVVS